MSDKKETLNKYRGEIDVIDNKIIDLLVERIGIVNKVGELKGLKHSKESIIRPGREATMVRRVAELSDAFPKAAMAQIWRLIISSAINVEEDARISTLSNGHNRDSFWLAREYFGSFTPTTQRPVGSEVLQDVLNGFASVGVLPLWEHESSHAWWAKLAEIDDYPHVFSKLPFIQLAPSTKVPLVAIGYVKPEETGEDESLWIIRAPEYVQFSQLEPILHELGLDYIFQETCRIMGNPTMHYYLIEIQGFKSDESKEFKAFNAKVASLFANVSVPVDAKFVGAYAIPLFCD